MSKYLWKGKASGLLRKSIAVASCLALTCAMAPVAAFAADDTTTATTAEATEAAVVPDVEDGNFYAYAIHYSVPTGTSTNLADFVEVYDNSSDTPLADLSAFTGKIYRVTYGEDNFTVVKTEEYTGSTFTQVGEYKAIITGTGEYTGSTTTYFQVVAANDLLLSDVDVEKTDISAEALKSGKVGVKLTKGNEVITEDQYDIYVTWGLVDDDSSSKRVKLSDLTDADMAKILEEGAKDYTVSLIFCAKSTSKFVGETYAYVIVREAGNVNLLDLGSLEGSQSLGISPYTGKPVPVKFTIYGTETLGTGKVYTPESPEVTVTFRKVTYDANLNRVYGKWTKTAPTNPIAEGYYELRVQIEGYTGAIIRYFGIDDVQVGQKVTFHDCTYKQTKQSSDSETGFVTRYYTLIKCADTGKVVIEGDMSSDYEADLVNAIGKNAFKGCKATSLVLGKDVATIGKNALKGANKLKTVTLKTSKLNKKNFTNLIKNSKVTTVKCQGAAKAKKATYKKWAKAINKSIKVK